jgi:hypothetical protein
VWAQDGFYVTPALSFAAVYDDNLFDSPSPREQDLISRFSPDLRLGYESSPLSLTARYTFDAEVYASHTELTTPQARLLAALEAAYRPRRPWTLGLATAYTETQRPQELNLVSGLASARQWASEFAFAPSTTYRFDKFTEGLGAYAFRRKQSGGETDDEHVADLRLSRRLTARDTGSLGYLVRYFRFGGDDGGGADPTTAQAVLFGWTRQLTALTRLEVRAGPRFSAGTVNAEALLAVRRRLPAGELAFLYARTQDISTGVGGVVNTDSVSALLSAQVWRALRLSAGPMVTRNTVDESEATVYQLRLHASYQLTKWLSLQGSYALSYQQGLLNSGPSTGPNDDEQISRNVVSVGISLSYPQRLY